MRKGFLASLVTFFVLSANAWGQIATFPPLELGECLFSCDDDFKCDNTCVWGSGDFLLWRIKEGPLPVPLVTSGNPADASPGALGQPGTLIVFGGDDLDFQTHTGVRATLGAYLDCERIIGVEGSGFLLNEESVTFSGTSDAVGNPPTYIPVFRADLGVEGAFAISDPARGFTGSLFINATTRLFGGEVNGTWKHPVTECLAWETVFGFRYLDLDEDIVLAGNLVDIRNGVFNTFSESFAGNNQFYGGQVGTRLRLKHCRFLLDFEGKLAIGTTRQQVKTLGTITQAGNATPLGTFPGGVLTQPSNLGSQSRNVFGFVPQGQVRVGFMVKTWLVVSATYDFLYWNDVVRPGNLIDRSINRTQQLNGTLTGPARPAQFFSDNDFFAHGGGVRVEVRY